MQPTPESASDSPADHSSDPSLQTDLTALIEAEIATIQALPTEMLPEYALSLIPNERTPSLSFMESLSPSEMTDTLLACLLVWTLSGGTEVPREFQITAFG
jgi:hypothetical protein